MNISEVRHGQSFLPPTVTEMQTAERPPYYPRKVLRFPALKRNRENVPLNERVSLLNYYVLLYFVQDWETAK